MAIYLHHILTFVLQVLLCKDTDFFSKKSRNDRLNSVLLFFCLKTCSYVKDLFLCLVHIRNSVVTIQKSII